MSTPEPDAKGGPASTAPDSPPTGDSTPQPGVSLRSTQRRWIAGTIGFGVLAALTWLTVRSGSPGGSGTGSSSTFNQKNATPSATARKSTDNPSTPSPDSVPEASATRHFTKSLHYPAALVIAGMEENSTRVEALEALMETWVADAPELAADWAGSLPAGIFRDEALSSLMFHWGKQAPADAARWMTRTGVDDPEAVSVLSGHWGATDPAAAAAWAATLTNLESRRDAAGSVAGAWALTDPQAAAAWATRLPTSERAAAIVNVLSAWALTSPSSAAAWLDTQVFSSENDHAAALAALVTPWTAQSPAAVSRYLNTLPEGFLRDAAAGQFAVTAAATAPAEALMWAMNLTDPAQRNQVVADACETWYDESPESFRSGVAEALDLMEDPAMRRGVYEMLYDRDPSFHANLLQLADGTPAAITSTSPILPPSPGTLPPQPDNFLQPFPQAPDALPVPQDSFLPTDEFPLEGQDFPAPSDGEDFLPAPMENGQF